MYRLFATFVTILLLRYRFVWRDIQTNICNGNTEFVEDLPQCTTVIDESIVCDLRYDFIVAFYEMEVVNDISERGKWRVIIAWHTQHKDTRSCLRETIFITLSARRDIRTKDMLPSEMSFIPLSSTTALEMASVSMSETLLNLDCNLCIWAFATLTKPFSRVFHPWNIVT
jgi:hypothetical protein